MKLKRKSSARFKTIKKTTETTCMRIDILSTESMGTRGLCCRVTTGDRRILIDPGIALGYLRHGRLPHPFQIALGTIVREKIIRACKDATDIVFSHFHGDHIPLDDANPYQLSLDRVAGCLGDRRVWAPDPEVFSDTMRRRGRLIFSACKCRPVGAEGGAEGPFRFSGAMPHGDRRRGADHVMMTRIKGERGVFVHASDIQLIDREPIDQILDWQPDVVLVSGPPLYLKRLSPEVCQKAFRHARLLSENVKTLIIDHHLLRNEEGISRLDQLRRDSKNTVVCAADFMGVERRFLEAWREKLYQDMPVPLGWHEKYSNLKLLQNYLRWKHFDLSEEFFTAHGKIF